MQLLVLVLMLMMSGKNANMKELKPILEEFGGGQAAEAFKQAEELSDMISAVQSLAKMSGATAADTAGGATTTQPQAAEECAAGDGFPLAPIANIADERITYCLSRYIALGE